MEFGTVESLWRYPVKSLIGERLENLEIDTRGVSGDRIYAISNSDGKLGSGKNTRRFSEITELFSMSAYSSTNGVSIKFPDGLVLTDKDSNIHCQLSQTLGQSVTLTKEDQISHFDDGAIHILTTSSLSTLKELLPEAGIDVRRFRPNILIDSQHSDEKLVGKTIQIGNTVLQITHRTERCRMITLGQPGLKSSPGILRTISREFGLHFGVYAKVLSTGQVSVGDMVKIESPEARSGQTSNSADTFG